MVRPGDRLGDRYQIVEQIGAGGMGTLWRAHHIELDVDVALKVVSTSGASPGSLQRFKREARAAAKLRSPNIVQVLDYGEFEGQPYLAMELLEGEDLQVRLERLGRTSIDSAVRIVDGIAKGVQFAHDAGVIHRDLKPANIFVEKVGDEEIVKILDFGVARNMAVAVEPSSTTAVGIVGSPAYLSPEQAWGNPIDQRADVWSMGVIAFEMLAGENPFSDETLAKIFERILRSPLPKPSQFESSIPASLDLFFDRALARAPQQRFGSAKEFAEAFRAAAEGQAANRPRPDSAFAAGEETLAGAQANIRRSEITRPVRTIHRRSIAIVLGALALMVATAFALASRQRQMSEANQSEHAERQRQSDIAASTIAALGAQAISRGSAGPEVPNQIPSTRTPVLEEHPSPGAPPKHEPLERRTAPSPRLHPAPSAVHGRSPPTLDPRFGIPLSQ